MYSQKKILALIPARGGSKGLPKKNIKPFAGKPLIGWTIEAGKYSKYIDSVIVSTEDNCIATIASQYDAEIPFIRPSELSTDDAKSIDVILHALNWLNQNNEVFEILILLQPTSPLRTSMDIDCAIEFFFEKNAKALISVSEVEHSPLWCNSLPEDLNMSSFLKDEVLNRNRQELPLYYRINGAIYMANTDYLQREKSFFGTQTYAYIMPKEKSIDIDCEIDFKIAEFLKRKNFDSLV